MVEESSSALSLDVRIRPEETRWAKRKSVEIRLGIEARDIGNLDLDDFIDEAMVDVQADLDLVEIDYSSWTSYSLVPGQIKKAVIYGTIEILVARKLESFKTRVVPSMGPIRYEIVERDAMKAINYFKGKRDSSVEIYVRTLAGGDVMRSSTIDEEPVFDMDDLEDKVLGVKEETSWLTWLLGHSYGS